MGRDGRWVRQVREMTLIGGFVFCDKKMTAFLGRSRSLDSQWLG